MLAVIVAPQQSEVRNLKELLLRNTHAAPAPLSPTNTSASIKDRHPRLRWWLGPMADDLLTDVPYPRRALRVARWSAVEILCFILATLAFSTLPPEALPSVLVMATIEVAPLYLLTRGLTWGERWYGLCKVFGYVIVFPATIILVLLLATDLLNSVLDM